MNNSKLVSALKYTQKLSRKQNESNVDFQELTSILLDAIGEIEGNLNGIINNKQIIKLKLCLLQLRYTIKKISQVLLKSSSSKSTIIFKLLNKKIYLCLKESVKVFDEEHISSNESQEEGYHYLMSEILSALSSQKLPSNFNNMTDNLLCSCLTIAKLSLNNDFKEINASCKNILDILKYLKDESSDETKEHCFSIDNIMYHIKLLERKVNSAMLRLFLNIMSYPQASLKQLIKKCGTSPKSEKFSEDLDDEISDFDLTCDRIALIGNFAIKSCERENLRLEVQSCLANLEFCEESLVPACINFYLEPNRENREFLKYLSGEWKSEVIQLNSLLDSIVDPAAFSLVVLEDLFEVIQKLKTSNEDNRESLFKEFYQKCLKLTENMFKSRDCDFDTFLVSLKNSLLSALKKNQIINTQRESGASINRIQHLDVALSVVDQISEHLNKILNASASTKSWSVSFSTLKDLSCNDSTLCQNSADQPNMSLIPNDWMNRCKIVENGNYNNIKDSIPSRYIERVQMCSPFVFTMYQKTPTRKKKDNLTLALDFPK